MLGELITLWDTTGDKVYVNVWLVVFVATVVGLLVWAKVFRR